MLKVFNKSNNSLPVIKDGKSMLLKKRTYMEFEKMDEKLSYYQRKGFIQIENIVPPAPVKKKKVDVKKDGELAKSKKKKK